MKSFFQLSSLLATALMVGAPAFAQNAKAPAPKEDTAYERSIEASRRAAEEQAKVAQAQQAANDKRAKDEAENAKRVADAKAAEAAQREKEEAELRAVEAKRLKEEQRRQAIKDRERSCQIKPVMSDAEIANCKTVWK